MCALLLDMDKSKLAHYIIWILWQELRVRGDIHSFIYSTDI